MWGSKGRSGYGDSTIGGDYDSWDGLSMNGRQYRNEVTMETRDLSGADYWHLRKQNRPTEEIPAELHMLSKGRANIAAYADPAPTKKKTSVSLVDRVLPQQRRVRVLTEQLYELESERKNGMGLVTYSQLRDILIVKRDRAQVLLEKALATKPIRPETSEDEEEIPYSSSFTDSDNNRHRESYSSPVGGSFFAEVVDGLSETNSLKSFLKMSCKVVRKAVHLSQATRNYIKTLSEV